MIIRVLRENGEKARRILSSKGLLGSYQLESDEEFVYIGTTRELAAGELEELNAEKSDRLLQPRVGLPQKLEDLLEKELSEGEREILPASYDIIGKVIVLTVPDELVPKERLIADALLKVHKQVRTVAKRTGPVSGTFRIKELEILAGPEDTETTYKESGCMFRLDPKKVYFSPREATERLRIAGQVQPGEKVLVMFAGIGSFPVIIAKTQPDAGITAIEINPDAYRYMQETIALNKLESIIKPILGDVREVCPNLPHKFDRVLMPLPKGAEQFLAAALPCLKSGGILHFYSWGPEDDLFSGAEAGLKAAAQKLWEKLEILQKKKVLPYAPREWKVVLDVRLI